MEAEKPLITIGIMCYNLEGVIAETLESAFAQTYSPLEIVVSDNASEDQSWEVIQRTVADYQARSVEPGKPKHRVIINRNDHNLNIMGNLQKIAEISHGEFIVKLDGDDIAYPNRIEVIVDDWIRNNREAVMMVHSYIDFDEKGEFGGFKYATGWDTWEARLRDGCVDNVPRSLTNGLYREVHTGAAAAYHRKLFDCFPRVEILEAMDDRLLQTRALIMDKIRTMDRILVKHRIGGVSTARISYRKKLCRMAHYEVGSFRQSLIDLESVRNALPAGRYDALCAIFNRNIEVASAKITLAEGNSIADRYRAFRFFCRIGMSKKHTAKACIQLVFPNSFGDWLLDKII